MTKKLETVKEVTLNLNGKNKNYYIVEGNYLFLLANELLLKSQHESSESSIWHFSSLIQSTDFCFYNGKQT